MVTKKFSYKVFLFVLNVIQKDFPKTVKTFCVSQENCLPEVT